MSTDPSGTELETLVAEYHRNLEACKEIYSKSALEYAQAHPDRIKEPLDAFVRRMLDLERGLVLKVFVEIAHVKWKWSEEELVLARELFEHVYGKRLNDTQLKEALNHVLEQVGLTWDSLVGPFDRLTIFRERAGQLQALVVRMANLIAKVDGRVSSDEVKQIQWIQSELHRVLDRVPLVDDADVEVQQSAGHKAVATKVRSAYQLEELPTAQIIQPSADQDLQDVLDELDKLIGLLNIKQDMRELVNFLKVQTERKKMGLSQTQVTLHSVFSGNPGTGKTTVARLMGRMFGAMGILKKGHLVETDRSGLVAEFAGQTAPKANKRIDEALDGVLFIDEAYSLVAESGDDPYGGEALQVLLKRMEDNRDRLIVVLAGYPKPLDRLLKSNPGLSSRFNRHFSFLDYTAGELGHIFQLLCEQNQYEIPPATRAKILTGFAHLLDVKDEHFGNGRLARNVFEMSIRRLANRIAKIAPLTREILTTIQPEDIIMEGVPAEVWNAMETDGVTFRVSCSKCSHTSKLPAKLLGRRVQCKKCQHSFAADWADVQLRQTEDV